jgi:hypothetical protein
MNQDEIIELAIQGHASTRDAIRWDMNQERLACAEVCLKVKYDPAFGVRDSFATAIKARGEV